MKSITIVAAALVLATTPLAAQDEAITIDVEEAPANAEADEMAAFMKLMGGLFTAEPLTPEQEQRLPLASEVVAVMTPPGYYAGLMDGVMSSMLGPMLNTLSGPAMAEGLLTRHVGLEDEEVPELSEEQRARVVALLDPAAPQRAEAMNAALTTWMSDAFRQIEDPLRDAFAKAYATRFTEAQLRDVQRFFATPTGAHYARQTFGIYADPQVMAASMQIMPAMMSDMDGFTAAMEAAFADLPEERGYRDLSAAERQELAGLLGMSEVELRSSMEAAEQPAEDHHH